MPFRFVNQAPQFFTVDGKVLAGGSLTFYANGTTNLQDTYTGPDLSAKNTNPVILDAAGRAESDIWLDGTYSVEIKDASGASIWTRDNVQGSQGLPSQTGKEGGFLKTNGMTSDWVAIAALPDATGQDGKFLQASGGSAVWKVGPTAPTIPTLPIVVAANSVQWGNTGSTAALIQTGSGTAPASGTTKTSLAVTFPTVFGACTHVTITPIGSAASGPYVGYLTAAPTANGFTAEFDIAEGNANGATVVNPVDFTWIAYGTKATS